MKYNLIKAFAGVYLLLSMGCNNQGPEGRNAVSDSLRRACIQVLRDVMTTESQFVKVHAAEYLLWLGHPDGVRDVFLKEEKQSATLKPYRIGIWRVLAQAAPDSGGRALWVNKIRQAFLDTSGSDRVNAAETLAKLKEPLAPDHPDIVSKAIESTYKPLSIYSRWAASVSSEDSTKACREFMMKLIQLPEEDSIPRLLAPYILRHIDGLTRDEWKRLYRQAMAETDIAIAKTNLLSAAFVTCPEDSAFVGMRDEIHRDLVARASFPRAADRKELAEALAEKGTMNDLPVLVALLQQKNPLEEKKDNSDVSAAAAFAILKLDQRIKP